MIFTDVIKCDESNRSAPDSGMEDGSLSAEDEDEPKKKKAKSCEITVDNKKSVQFSKGNKKTVNRCETCHQILDNNDLRLYQVSSCGILISFKVYIFMC